MSDYTIVSLGDVENVAPRYQMPEGMDVRFPRRDLGCKIGGVMRNLEAGDDGITLVAFGAPLGEQSGGEIVPGWWEG
jgi:hypothetical protein